MLTWLFRFVSGGGPVERLGVLGGGEAVRNGGGPDCLRLRVQTDAGGMAAIDSRYLLNQSNWESLYRLIEAWWPERIEAADLGRVETWHTMWSAHVSLLEHLKLPQ